MLLVAVPPELPTTPAPTPLDLDQAVTVSDGTHLRHRQEGVDLQLLILRGASPDRPLAALVPLDADMLDRIHEVERFWRASRDRRVPADPRLTLQQRAKLRLMLQAVDGRAQRASYREIGEVLFGRDRIAEFPWKTSPWRARVNRLVRNGHAMIAGGYRQLLRPRRRS